MDAWGDGAWKEIYVIANKDYTFYADIDFPDDQMIFMAVFDPLGSLVSYRYIYASYSMPVTLDFNCAYSTCRIALYKCINDNIPSDFYIDDVVVQGDSMTDTNYVRLPLAGYRFGFNGKEKDDEVYGDGNEYDFGARIYDPRVGRWLRVDPLASKYPHTSPYVSFNNNPIIYIDPDGKENIVVIGGVDKGQNDRYKFVNSGLGQAIRYAHSSEQTTIVLVTAYMTADEVQQVKDMATAGGINFVSVSSADEVANYMNSKTTTSSDVSKARLGDKITDVSVYGHGIAGSMEFGYDYVSGPKSEEEQQMSFGADEIGTLNPEAFDNADIQLYTCNSATDKNGVNVAKDLSKQSNSTVSGYKGQSSYKGIYGILDRLLKKLGTEILPASNNPEAGQNAEEKTYTNGKEQ